MQRPRFDRITLEFDLQGHHYRTQPADLTATEVPCSQEPQPQSQPKPRYSLRKGLGVWHLTFDGQEAGLKHERGIFYVAWLLTHPPEHPIHALDLIAKIPELYRQQLGLTQIADSATRH